MGKQYKVIGDCAVADVEPGGTVSQEALEKARALIGPLLGVHLEEIAEPAEKTPAKPKPEAKTP